MRASQLAEKDSCDIFYIDCERMDILKCLLLMIVLPQVALSLLLCVGLGYLVWRGPRAP